MAPGGKGDAGRAARGSPHYNNPHPHPFRSPRAMAYTIQSHLQTQLREIESAGLLKRERVITSPQQSHIRVTTSATDVINLCANNYLGLADDPRLCAAAKAAIDRY